MEQDRRPRPGASRATGRSGAAARRPAETAAADRERRARDARKAHGAARRRTSGRRGSREVLAHHKRRRRLAVRAAIIARALGRPRKSRSANRARSRRHCPRRPPGTSRARPKAARAADARATGRGRRRVAQGGIDRDGQDFRLVGGEPRQREAAQAARGGVERGRAERRGAREQRREFSGRPGMGEAVAVNGGAFSARRRARARMVEGVGGETEGPWRGARSTFARAIASPSAACASGGLM